MNFDGRFVIVRSRAEDLKEGLPDPNPNFDKLYVHDRVTGDTEMLTVSFDNSEGADRESLNARLNDDGTIAVFESTSANLLSDTTMNSRFIYARDRNTQTNELISIDPAGNREIGLRPTVSGDGRYVAYVSAAGPIRVRDRVAQTTIDVSVDRFGNPVDAAPAHISRDGNSVVFRTAANDVVEGDTNDSPDLFVWRRATNSIDIVTVDAAGLPLGNATDEFSIDGDASRVAFETDSALVAEDTNADTDIYVRDLSDASTRLVSVDRFGQAGGDAAEPRIDAAGERVVFSSSAPDMVPNYLGDGLFLRRLDVQSTELVGLSADGTPLGLPTTAPATRHDISGDGLRVGFGSAYDQVVDGDTNGDYDIFVRDLADPPPSWVLNGGYAAGDVVVNRLGGLYECIQPGIGWCETRNPGIDLGWEGAWRFVESCFVLETFELRAGNLFSDGDQRQCSDDEVELHATLFSDVGGFIGVPPQVTVAFYLADGPGLGTRVAETRVMAPEIGESKTVSATWSDPVDGLVRLRVVVDPEDEIAELDEGNNATPHLAVPGIAMFTCH